MEASQATRDGLTRLIAGGSCEFELDTAKRNVQDHDGPPPPETLLSPTARLPLPLQRFRGRAAVFAAAPDAPEVTFPPDGAQIDGGFDALMVKIKNGTLPLVVLANGRPVATGLRRRDVAVTGLGKGASTLTVIDAQGQLAPTRIWVD